MWVKRCELLLKDDLSTADMMKLIGKGHEVVKNMRIEIVADLKERGILLADPMRIPTEFFLEKIGKTYEYFELNAVRQIKLNELKDKLK